MKGSVVTDLLAFHISLPAVRQKFSPMDPALITQTSQFLSLLQLDENTLTALSALDQGDVETFLEGLPGSVNFDFYFYFLM